MPAQRIDSLRMLANQQVAREVQHPPGLLCFALHRHKAHRGTRGRRALRETVKVFPRFLWMTMASDARAVCRCYLYRRARQPHKDYHHVRETLSGGAVPKPDDAASAVSGRLSVRAQCGARVDAFVGTLDLEALGFAHAEANSGTGQPAFDPALLLKLYLNGYQHRVRSSRRLEARRDVIWK